MIISESVSLYRSPRKSFTKCSNRMSLLRAPKRKHSKVHYFVFMEMNKTMCMHLNFPWCMLQAPSEGR